MKSSAAGLPLLCLLLFGFAPDATLTGDPIGSPRRYLPPLPTGTVEYLILTSKALRESWLPYAEAKTLSGTPADIVTVDEITSNPAFAGCDPQEKIRKFVEHLHRDFGLKWLLIGGDTDQVPGRYVIHRMGEKIKPYVVDSYYGCFGGDWNTDRNAEFAQVLRDETDLEPQVFVGRVPAQTPRDVETWLAKWNLYRNPKHRDYQKRALMIGANVFREGDAEAYYRKLSKTHFEPDRWEVTFMLPSSKNCTERKVFGEITKGHGVISHYQHSFMYNIGLDKGAITVYNYREAKNAERPSVMFSNGCNVCQFDYRSIAETLLLSDAGGVVSFIGSSETNYSISLRYEEAFWKRIFEDGDTIGQAIARAKASLYQKRYSTLHFISTSLSLLGDPQLAIWLDKPGDLDVKVKGNRVKVAGNGIAVGSATVCVSADGFYARGVTDENGEWSMPSPRKSGQGTLRVAARGFVDHSREIKLNGSRKPALRAVRVGDREFTAKDGVFHLPGPPTGYRFTRETREIEAVLHGGSVQRLELSNGETYLVVLPQTGYELSASVTGKKEFAIRVVRLGSEPGPVEVKVQSPDVGGIAFEDGRFRFKWTSEHPPQFTATVTGPAGKATKEFDLDTPPEPPSEIQSEPDVNKVRLTWDPPERGLAGYRIYRDDRLLTPTPVIHATFLDAGLRGLSRHTYRISSVGVDGVEGPLSDPIRVSTSLRRLDDWPKRTGAQMSDVVLADLNGNRRPELLAGDAGKGLWVWRRDGSEWRHGGDNWTFGLFRGVEGGVFTPVVADIDGDRKNEIITCGRGDNRQVYVWDLDGKDKKGWPQKVGGRPMTAPRVADLDGDGRLEIIFVGGFGKGVWIWKADGSPFGKQAKVKDIAPFNYFLGPILDLDEDGVLEITVLDGAGNLQAIRPDGSSVEGFPVKLGGPGRAAVCAGDVDGDRKVDLVCLAKGGTELVVVDAKGKILKGFPVKIADKNENHSYSCPALAELDGKKGVEIVVGGYDKRLHVIRGDGTTMKGWPRKLDGIGTSIAVGDLDDDGDPEIVVATNAKTVQAFEVGGEPVPGFPLRTQGANRGVPFLGDFDGDRKLDILMGSQDGHVHAWSLDVPFRNDRIEWNGQSNGLNFPAVYGKRRKSEKPWTVPKTKKRRPRRR